MEKLNSFFSWRTETSTTSTQEVEEKKTEEKTGTPAEQRILKANYQFKNGRELSDYSIIEENPEFKQFKVLALDHLEGINKLGSTPDKIIGAMYGMNVGDALGAPFEFQDFDIKGYTKSDEKITMTPKGIFGSTIDTKNSRFGLKSGQWTDDASMGLCLADSLIENKGLDGYQLMIAFKDWWAMAYNTAFNHGTHGAVGLGGNISQSFYEYKINRTDSGDYETKAGDKNTSGNGSLMRNASSAILAISLREAELIGWKQSKVTHQGDEAAACCQLMSHLMYKAIYEGATKETLFKEIEKFECSVPSVEELAQSKGEWNWKDPNFCFNKTRLKQQPGYIGSYAMDALTMALHCIYTTNSFEEAVLKAATRGGDADSVGTITAQIAGSIYGANAIPKDWIKAVQQWDRQGEVGARGLILQQIREERLK